MVFKFLLSFSNALVEPLKDRVPDPFKVLGLVHAEDGQRVLGKRANHSFVAKCLVAHPLKVSVLFEFCELLSEILVEWV
jgi:hypothetical protein